MGFVCLKHGFMPKSYYQYRSNDNNAVRNCPIVIFVSGTPTWKSCSCGIGNGMTHNQYKY